MSEISAALTYVEGRIERTEGDNPPLTEFSIHMAAWTQTQATLLLAEQVKRIADILDSAMEVDPENPGAGRYVWVRVREE